MGTGGDEAEPSKDRIVVPADPWNSSTGDEDWIVSYDIPDGDTEIWEVTPAE